MLADYANAVDAFSKNLAQNHEPTREKALISRANASIRIDQYANAEKDLKILLESPDPATSYKAQMMLAITAFTIDYEG